MILIVSYMNAKYKAATSHEVEERNSLGSSFRSILFDLTFEDRCNVPYFNLTSTRELTNGDLQEKEWYTN